MSFTPGRLWTSPASQARYPIEWTLQTPAGRHRVVSLLDAQELDSRASTGNVALPSGQKIAVGGTGSSGPLRPQAPRSSEGRSTAAAMEAFANGGLLGRGPGEGRVKNVLPDAHADFVFAVAGEGQLEVETATGEVRATGKLNAAADRLGVVQPEFAAMGAVLVLTVVASSALRFAAMRSSSVMRMTPGSSARH